MHPLGPFSELDRPNVVQIMATLQVAAVGVWARWRQRGKSADNAGMVLLIGGLALFMCIHLIPTRPSLRAAVVGTLGPGIYRVLFSLVSIAGLVLIVLGYGHMQGLGRGNPQLWVPPAWTKHVVFLLMIPAMILLVAAYVPSRIRSAVGHPMLTALMIWAFAHLLANGDLASVLLFGSLLGFAVYDRISVIDRASPGPLGNAMGGALHDIPVIAAGLGLYALMLFWGHAKLIGVPLLP
jgi:uncharacterized membrane protein